MMHIEDLIRDDGTEEVGDASKGLVAHHHAALLHHTALCHHVSSSSSPLWMRQYYDHSHALCLRSYLSSEQSLPA